MDRKKQKIIFIFWRLKVKTGGERIDSFLWGIAKTHYTGATVIELDVISERLPKWLMRKFSIKYLERTIKVISYAIALPKEKNILIYTHFDLSRYLFLYLFIMRYFYSSKIIIYNHLIDYCMSERLNNNRGKLFIENGLMRLAHIILTNSVYSKNKLVSFGIPEKRIKIIYPLLLDWPVNHTRRLEKGRERIRLLFVGTEFLRKGLKPLLGALLIIDRCDISLKIVGDVNKEFNAMFLKANSDLIKRLETKNMVSFLGWVAEAHRKEELFTEADIFVMPSLSEGFGIVFAEAMAYSLPIIAADTTATSELVRHGYNGILVPADNSKALAAAIETLVNNKDMRIKMGNNGHKMIKGFYESYSIEKKFCSVLQELSILPQ